MERSRHLFVLKILNNYKFKMLLSRTKNIDILFKLKSNAFQLILSHADFK